MLKVNPSTNTADPDVELNDDLGVFEWDLNTTLLHGDSVFAKFFGLLPDIVEKGLPIERYLGVVHEEDRKRVARTLHETIVHGGLCYQQYRLTRADRSTVHVTGIGRCFRDQKGEPLRYVGVMLDVTAISESDKIVTMISHCLAAQSIAGDLGMDDVGSMLDDVVSRIRHEQAFVRH